MRKLELTAGAPHHQGKPGVWSTNTAMRQAEKALAKQAEAAYARTVADLTARQKSGAGATPGRASK